MDQLSDTKIIFKGTKCFWNTKNSLEIVIVEHKTLGVVEVITYDHTIKTESERLYLKTSDLAGEIKSDELVLRMNILLKHGKKGRHIVQEEVEKAKGQYIFNHMFIAEYLPETKFMRIEIRSRYPEERQNDRKSEHLVLECHRPEKLIPYPTSFGQQM